MLVSSSDDVLCDSLIDIRYVITCQSAIILNHLVEQSLDGRIIEISIHGLFQLSRMSFDLNIHG